MRLCVDVVSSTGEHLGGPVSAVVHDGDKSTLSTFVNKIRHHLLIPFTDFSVLGPNNTKLDATLPSFRQVLEAASIDVPAPGSVGNTVPLTLQLDATEESLAKQLHTLFDRCTGGAVLSLEELGLMYCYQYGVTLNQALKIISSCTKRNFLSVSDFLKACTQLQLQGGRLSKDKDQVPSERDTDTAFPWNRNNGARPELKLQTRSPPGLAKQTPPGLMPVVVPVPASGSDALSWRTPAAAAADASADSPSQKKVKEATAAAGEESEEELKLQELHKRVASRAFSSRVAQTLTQVEAQLQDALKVAKPELSLKSIARGGAAGKGTLISTTTDATLLLLFSDMQHCDGSLWQETCKQVLEAHPAVSGPITTCNGGRALSLKMQPGIQVTVQAATAYDDYNAALQTLKSVAGEEDADEGALEQATLALLPDQTAFISKQPGRVKVTIRLVKWWRDQQRWTSAKTRPSDKFLELACISVHRASKPATQYEAFTSIMALLSKFSTARITWSNFYDPAAISPQLRQETPLMMDPADPTCNVASPADFDCAQLMELAASPSAKLC